MEVNLDQATHGEYPSKVEVEDVHPIQEALIHVGVGNLRHRCELAGETQAVIPASNEKVVIYICGMRNAINITTRDTSIFQITFLYRLKQLNETDIPATYLSSYLRQDLPHHDHDLHGLERNVPHHAFHQLSPRGTLLAVYHVARDENEGHQS